MIRAIVGKWASNLEDSRGIRVEADCVTDYFSRPGNLSVLPYHGQLGGNLELPAMSGFRQVVTKLPETPFSRNFVTRAKAFHRLDYFLFADKRGSQVGLEAGVGKGLLDGTRLVSWPLLKSVKCSPSL
jgi:hypothetical protein